MKKILCLLLVVVLMFSLIACGAEVGDGEPVPRPSIAPGGGGTEGGIEGSDSDLDVEYGETERLIAYKFNVYLEVEDLETAYKDLKNNLPTGSWIENEDYDRENATIVLRVPTSRSESFVDGLGSYGEIVSKRITSEDFTSSYTNVNSTIEILEIEKGRLIELLKSATVTESITINKRLAEIEISLKQLTNASEDYVSLHEYSIVTVHLNSEYIPENPSYFSKFGAAITSGFGFFVTFFALLIQIILFLIPFLCVAGVVLAVVIKVKMIKRKKEISNPNSPRPTIKKEISNPNSPSPIINKEINNPKTPSPTTKPKSDNKYWEEDNKK